MDVSAHLEAHKSKYKPITVEKPIPLEFDLALLAGFDTNALDDARLKDDTDAYLKECTRDGTQLVINEIFKLPLTSSEAGVLAELPPPVTAIPREKPLPKAKPLTRWEKFAKRKGIHKRKDGRLVFDEEKREWVPKWGYKGANDDGANDWLIPVPDNADPYEDQFEKRREVKKGRISKNEANHRRNQEEASGAASARLATAAEGRAERNAKLLKQISITRTSTASVGKFDKMEGGPKPRGVKRKFEPTVKPDMREEKESTMAILNKVVGGPNSVLNVRKAIRTLKQP